MIPRIDPAVRHVGVSYLRKLNASQLRQLEGAIVICDNSEPLAVIVSYETFMRIQKTHIVLSDGVDKAIRMIDAVSPARLDAAGPELSQGRGKASVETRGMRAKGDSKR